MTYILNREDVKELASQILGCSPERLRVRCKYAYKGEILQKRDGVLYFVTQSDNMFATLTKLDDTRFKFERSYKDKHFFLKGKGVWLPDGLGFFCDSSVAVPDGIVYLECTQI